MKKSHYLEIQCELLAEQAIIEALSTAMEEEGVDGALKLLSLLSFGEVLPAPVIMHWQRNAAKLAGRHANHSA